MRRPIYFTLSFLALVAAMCTKDETTPRQYPRVETNDVSDISGKGATFHASITYSSVSITDHGFIWSDSKNFDFSNSEILSLGSASGAGRFDTQVERDLAANKQFYVKAYAKSENYTVYGNVVSFLSLGSLAPEVDSFSPSTASIGDTIVIRGKNFSIKPAVNVITFDTVSASVILVSDSVIKAKVPDGLLTIISQLSVSVYGNKGTAKSSFTLTPPQITAVDKTTVGLCDTLVMSVMHLPTNLSKIKVLFNSTSTVPITLSAGKLKVPLPFLPAGTTAITLKLTYGPQVAIYPNSLTYLEPKLLSITPTSGSFLDTLKLSAINIPPCNLSIKVDGAAVTPIEFNSNYFRIIVPKTVNSYSPVVSVSFGSSLLFQTQFTRTVSIESVTPTTGIFDDIITINGHGFHPDASQNTVVFAGTPAQIVSNTTRQIKFKIPENISVNSDGTAVIGVSSVFVSAPSSPSFKVNSPVISTISPAIISNYSTVTLTGINFNPNTAYNSLKIDQAASNALSIISATPTSLIFSAPNNSLTYDPNYSKGYKSSLSLNVSGQVTTSLSQDSISYLGPWTQKTQPPITARRYAVSFGIGSKLYYGLGWDLSAGNIFSDFWEYDTNSDTWTQLADFPGGARLNAANWSANNFGYVGMGLNGTTAYTDMWKFDPTSKTWTRLSDFPGNPASGVFPGNEDFAGATVMNGQVYVAVAISQFWKYDPGSDFWTRLNDATFNIGRTLNSKNFIYAIVGTGNSNPFPLYRYDISSDSWSASSYIVSGAATYFSALGNLYQTSYPLLLIQYSDSQNATISFPAPFYAFNYFFEGSGKIYFIDFNNNFWQLDPALYPLKP